MPITVDITIPTISYECSACGGIKFCVIVKAGDMEPPTHCPNGGYKAYWKQCKKEIGGEKALDRHDSDVPDEEVQA